MPETKFV